MDLLIGVDERNFISVNIVLYFEEFSLEMETNADTKNKLSNNAPNINRNRDIYEGIINYLAAFTQVRINN
jgi:predicted secreted Zn-dependent protease